jgi:hypothetical protein
MITNWLDHRELPRFSFLLLTYESVHSRLANTPHANDKYSLALFSFFLLALLLL